MSRPLRIQYSNAWYHVMNRGRHGDQVFEIKDDYEGFVDVLHEVICHYYNINENQLYVTKRAVFNEARAMGLFLTRRLRDETLKIIGEHFQIENYSTVSSVIDRFKHRLQSDRQLLKRVYQVRQAIMSQGKT